MKKIHLIQSIFLAFFLFISGVASAQHSWSGTFLTGPVVGCSGLFAKTVSHSNSYGCNSATTNISLQYSANNISFSTLSTQSATGSGGVYFGTVNFTNSGYYRFIISGSTAPITCSNVSLAGYTSPSTYFTISKPPVVNFNINGNTAVTPTVIQTYSCVAINLNYTGTGTVDNYRLVVKEATSTGAVISSGYNSNSAGTWTSGAVPNPYNLNSGAIGTQFQASPGYYLVSLETDNANCAQSAVRTALIQVSGTPPASSAIFQLVKPDGSFTTGSTATTLPGLDAGPLTIALGGITNTSSTPSNLTGYQVTVQEYTAAGVFVATRTSTAVIAAPGGTLPGSLNLNSSSFSPANYFLGQCGAGLLTSTRRFKVTLTAQNLCGSSSTYSKYFYFSSQTDCFRSADYNAPVMEDADEQLATIELAAPAINVFPNPGSSDVSFEVNANEKDLVSIAVYDLKGNHVMNVVADAVAVAGSNVYSADLSILNAGIYVYQVKVNNDVYNGKLSRQ
jgi:hypothetical protein